MAPFFVGNRLIRFCGYCRVMVFRKLAPVMLFAAAMLTSCQDAEPATMAEAEAAIADNRFLDARKALLSWREDNGSSPENSALLAQVTVELGDGYTAERYLTELEPTRGTTPEWLALRARSLILQGKAWKARELVEQSTWPDAAAEEREYLLVWAAMEEGKIEEAIALVDRALRLYPEHSDLHARAARLAVWEGKWEAADLHIDAALASDPNNYDALLLRGESQIAGGELGAALETYQLAVTAHPDFAVPRANVVGLLLDLDRPTEAEAALNEAEREHGGFNLLRFNAARLHGIKGEWEKAREILQVLPSDWKRSFPAAILLEAETEGALGNHSMARTLYLQIANDPRFEQQVAELMAMLPPA